MLGRNLQFTTINEYETVIVLAAMGAGLFQFGMAVDFKMTGI